MIKLVDSEVNILLNPYNLLIPLTLDFSLLLNTFEKIASLIENKSLIMNFYITLMIIIIGFSITVSPLF